MKESLQNFSDRLDDKEETFLLAALAKTMKAAQDSPTAANLAAYDKARDSLDRCRARKKNLEADGTADVFPNTLSVHEHLKAQGWKIGRSKFYEDVKRRLIRQQSDGSFLRADVDRYAVENLDKPGAASSAENVNDRNAIARARFMETRAEDAEMELRRKRGELIERETVDSELAARAQVIKTDFTNLAYDEASELAKLTDPNKIREHLLGRFAKAFDRYAKPVDFTAELVGD